MMNAKAKVWLVVVIAAVGSLAAFFSVKKFSHSPSSPPPVHGEKPAEAPRQDRFTETVPIVFHVEKYREIPVSGEAFDPSVSPDGARIVFVIRTGGKTGIAVAELTGGKIFPLDTGLDGCSDPSWSADGEQIVFAGTKKGASEIYLYDLKEKRVAQVTSDPRRRKSRPRFSPHRFNDTYRIAYVSEEKGRKDIWWVRPTGRWDHPITVPPERMEEYRKSSYWKEIDSAVEPPRLVTRGGDAPEWSPSGNLILYRTAGGGYSILAYSYASWWRPTDIPAPSGGGLLSWSPNQNSFLDYDPALGRAAVIPRDTFSRKEVLTGKALTSQPSFFPDGRGFACTFRRDNRSVLAIEPYQDPLGDVANLWMYSYSARQREKLAANQLLFLHAEYDQIYSLYDTELYSCGADTEVGHHARPYLVTSDAVLETLYAAFSALYACVERAELAGALEEFARQGAAEARRMKVSGDVETMFLTGLVLLKPGAARDVRPDAGAEAARVTAASGIHASLFGKKIDYGDFFIRGKYERDTDLQGYFRALKWFQAFTFDLNSEKERKYAAEILSVAASPKVRPSLEKIYALYRGMVGESRYLNPLNLKAVPPHGAPATVTPGLPWIGMRDAFRLLPSVYTLDTYIFDELITHADRPETVGTLENPRMLPKGLDIMAAFGSGEARRILVAELKEGRYANYEKRLDEVTSFIGRFPRAAWDANLYQNWLDALATLVREQPEQGPAFTRTPGWRRKQLNTALGSWVNLRYETIAVVEQAVAECCEGGYEVLDVGRPKGYVEPIPEFFRGLDAGFAGIAAHLERAVRSPELRKGVLEKIAEYRRHLKTLETIARKELDGRPLTDKEYEEILYIGGTIEHFMLLMGSLNGAGNDQAIRTPEPIRKIVDVQKDPLGGRRLYEALGFADEIHVMVPYFGRRVIVKGPVYSYHEFTSEEALDSARWRKSGSRQPPVWIRGFYEGKGASPLTTLKDLAPTR
jgi:hypothetical protein